MTSSPLPGCHRRAQHGQRRANHLNKTIQAARLKGAQTIVSGICDEVAETIVDLGIDWSGIETLSDLQTGLMLALNSLGIKLAK